MRLLQTNETKEISGGHWATYAAAGAVGSAYGACKGAVEGAIQGGSTGFMIYETMINAVDGTDNKIKVGIVGIIIPIATTYNGAKSGLWNGAMNGVVLGMHTWSLM